MINMTNGIKISERELTLRILNKISKAEFSRVIKRISADLAQEKNSPREVRQTKENLMSTKKQPRLKKYRVNVCRIAYGNRVIDVEATSPKKAMRLAEAKAGDFEFTEHTSEYEAQGATLIN